MGNFIRDCVKYVGIQSYFEDSYLYVKPRSFKNTMIKGEVILSEKYPDIDQLIKVEVSIDIFANHLVPTPKGYSAAGESMTGYSAVVMGDLVLKIQYISEGHTQEVYSISYSVPFAEFLVMPTDFSLEQMINIELYVEDVCVQQKGKRSLLMQSVVLMVIED